MVFPSLEAVLARYREGGSCVFSSSFVYSQTLWFYVGLTRCVVDDFYFWYFVEGVVIFHEGTDALADVPDLDADIPQESTACPTSHDHDCFWVHFN